MNTTEKILQQKALRITPMRQLVLEYFIAKNKILGLIDLENVFPRADRITIYRTLKIFEEKGIVHRIEDGQSEVKYALCKVDCSEDRHIDDHPHFHCLNCGDISCLEEVFIPSLDLPEGYQLEEVNMMVKGVCVNCTT